MTETTSLDEKPLLCSSVAWSTVSNTELRSSRTLPSRHIHNHIAANLAGTYNGDQRWLTRRIVSTANSDLNGSLG